MEEFVVITCLFEAKHFFADFPLQNNYMLKKGQEKDWFFPLLAHSSVHSIGTLLIVLFFTPSLWWLSLVDLVIHFGIDRVKASPKMLGRWGVENSNFWLALGADQTMHRLTHFGLTYIMCV